MVEGSDCSVADDGLLGLLPLRSVAGLLCAGGPIVEDVVVGVTSIGSPGGVSDDDADVEGRMGIALCMPGA